MTKCLKCNKECDAENLVDGLCSVCLIDKHYCDECEFCDLARFDDQKESLRFATCKASQKENEMSVLSNRYDVKVFKYCTTERTADQCENFKFHAGA